MFSVVHCCFVIFELRFLSTLNNVFTAFGLVLSYTLNTNTSELNNLVQSRGSKKTKENDLNQQHPFCSQILQNIIMESIHLLQERQSYNSTKTSGFAIKYKRCNCKSVITTFAVTKFTKVLWPVYTKQEIHFGPFNLQNTHISAFLSMTPISSMQPWN